MGRSLTQPATPMAGTTLTRLPMRESAFRPDLLRHPMDIERINAIGSLLTDLSARTEQLRGYL